MTKEESCDIFDVQLELEILGNYLLDFDCILSEKSEELKNLSKMPCLESVKKEKVKEIRLCFLKCLKTLEEYNKRAIFFRKVIRANNFKRNNRFVLNCYGFSKNVKKFLAYTKSQIEKCDEALELAEKYENVI